LWLDEPVVAVNTLSNPQRLDWSERLQAIAQNRLIFARDPHDTERYAVIREIAAEMLAQGSGLEVAIVRGVPEGDSGRATPKVDMRGFA
jgi:hypothetical protein